jgi:hypothetical protein
MKKVFLIAIMALVLGGAGLVFAQNNTQGGNSSENKKFENESEFYYFSVPIEKIYSYRTGYVVQYRKGANKLALTYVPMEWFNKPDGKADLITLESGKSWPYLTVYYKAGEFSHIRLYVRRSRGHETWGVIPLNINIDERFEGIEEIKLEF